MDTSIAMLMTAAASIGFLHTLMGPDHYLPFVAMSKAGNWSGGKTALVTVLCGLGHVLSSVVLGFIGIALGIAVTSLEAVEAMRGSLAAWALIAFGLVYMVWGIRRAFRHKGESHTHGHVKDTGKMTPWILFIVFVLGPCEPLIPLLLYPAATSGMIWVWMVAIVFSAVTILTMLGMVLALRAGVSLAPKKTWAGYTHAVAGSIILLCGVSIQFLGL